MTRAVIVLACVLLFGESVSAQALHPLDTWVTASDSVVVRRWADRVSWGTALAAVAVESVESWQAEDRSRAYLWQGARVGVTYGAVLAVKALVHRRRPCAPECGADNPRFSFYSAHTALAWETTGGHRWVLTVPLAATTGGLRVVGGKHWLSDVLVGAGVGWVTGRLR